MEIGGAARAWRIRLATPPMLSCWTTKVQKYNPKLSLHSHNHRTEFSIKYQINFHLQRISTSCTPLHRFWHLRPASAPSEEAARTFANFSASCLTGHVPKRARPRRTVPTVKLQAWCYPQRNQTNVDQINLLVYLPQTLHVWNII